MTPTTIEFCFCTFIFYLLNTCVWVVNFNAQCRYVEKAANVTYVRRLDVYDFTEQKCEYGVEWAQKYTPWWSFRTKVKGATSDVLTLPCNSFDVHHIDGCYENSFRRPRFISLQQGPVVHDIFWFRLSAYLFVAPIVPILLTMADERIRKLHRERERVNCGGGHTHQHKYVPVAVDTV